MDLVGEGEDGPRRGGRDNVLHVDVVIVASALGGFGPAIVEAVDTGESVERLTYVPEGHDHGVLGAGGHRVVFERAESQKVSQITRRSESQKVKK
jgi:hypothetical protein